MEQSVDKGNDCDNDGAQTLQRGKVLLALMNQYLVLVCSCACEGSVVSTALWILNHINLAVQHLTKVNRRPTPTLCLCVSIAAILFIQRFPPLTAHFGLTVPAQHSPTFLGSGSDLKVFDGELLDVKDGLLCFFLPVLVFLSERVNPPRTQVVVFQGNLRRQASKCEMWSTRPDVTGQDVYSLIRTIWGRKGFDLLCVTHA